MSNNLKSLTVLICFLFDLANANSSEWYREISGSIAYNKEISSLTTNIPTIGQYSLGLAIGRPLIGSLNSGILGFLGFDFHWVSQYSDADPVIGNLTGIHWNFFSPGVLLKTSSLLLKAEYEFLGNYKLTRTRVGGVPISYKRPSGAKASLMTRIGEKIWFGVVAEYVYFKTLSFTTATLDDDNLIFYSGGLILAWEL
jgi:hypothetical protein